MRGSVARLRGLALQVVCGAFLVVMAALASSTPAFAIVAFNNGFTCAVGETKSESAGPFLIFTAPATPFVVAAGERLTITLQNATGGTIVRTDNNQVVLSPPGTSTVSFDGPLTVDLTTTAAITSSLPGVIITFSCAPNGAQPPTTPNTPTPHTGSATLFLNQNGAAAVNAMLSDAIVDLSALVTKTNCDEFKSRRQDLSRRSAASRDHLAALEQEGRRLRQSALDSGSLSLGREISENIDEVLALQDQILRDGRELVDVQTAIEACDGLPELDPGGAPPQSFEDVAPSDTAGANGAGGTPGSAGPDDLSPSPEDFANALEDTANLSAQAAKACEEKAAKLIQLQKEHDAAYAQMQVLAEQLDAAQGKQANAQLAGDTEAVAQLREVVQRLGMRYGAFQQKRDQLTFQILRLERELEDCRKASGLVFYAEPSHPAAQPSSPLDAFDQLLGGIPQDGVSFYTPLAYASTVGLIGDQQAGVLGGWSIWAKGSLSGLTSPGFSGLNGRIDLGASRPLGNGFTIGGFIGWDGGTTNGATPGDISRSNSIHLGGFSSYRLPNDIVLALSGGAAFGGLASTIGGDTGATATQRGFVSASLSGEIWSEGPWRLTSSGSLFVGAEHQDAFTTAGGTAVSAQTITLGTARIDAMIGYALPTELPMELFATAGAGANFGNSATSGFAGSIGGGLKVSQDAMHATIATTFGVAGAVRSWSLTAALGASF